MYLFRTDSKLNVHVLVQTTNRVTWNVTIYSMTQRVWVTRVTLAIQIAIHIDKDSHGSLDSNPECQEPEQGFLVIWIAIHLAIEQKKRPIH